MSMLIHNCRLHITVALRVSIETLFQDSNLLQVNDTRSSYGIVPEPNILQNDEIFLPK
jgi:hypothetical protein